MSAAEVELFSVLGVLFGLVAAFMAYLITYEEYQHHYAGQEKPKKAAFETGLFTFIAFFVLTLAAGFFLSRYVVQWK